MVIWTEGLNSQQLFASTDFTKEDVNWVKFINVECRRFVELELQL